MYSQNKTIIVLCSLFLLIICSKFKAQNIEVAFTGIRSAKGQIIMKIYKDDKGYEEDKPVKTMKFEKKVMLKGELSTVFNLEPGVYGFALLDDENTNNAMNYGFFGMPEEGFGFSNYYLTGLFKPKFEAFKFTVSTNQKQKIHMRIKYL